MRKKTLNKLILVLLAGLSQHAFAAYPTGSGTDHVTIYDMATYGANATITFNDWGYKGPQVDGYAAAGWNDFAVPGSGGFDKNRVGQVQKVVTYGISRDPVTGVVSNNLDWKSPDSSKTVLDGSGNAMPGAMMDGQTNFYKWAYTTPAGSTFNNMQIDKAGNYFIARDDMKFGFYDDMQYKNKKNLYPEYTYDTAINFQPYAVSDAQGWCGSVLSANPNGLEKMAGQVMFDFAFDAYMNNGHPTEGVGGGTQIVPGFVMRSYGDYKVVVQGANADETAQTTYTGNAVINNTNPNNTDPLAGPLAGEVDPAYQSKVSFLGGGVVPLGVWVTADSYNADGTRKLNADSTWQVTVAHDASGSATCTAFSAVRADGAHCYQNSFGGYGFLMRADGSRMLYKIGETGHSDYMDTDIAAYASIGQAAPVPVPAAAWLLGSGLIGLVGMARRKQAVAV